MRKIVYLWLADEVPCDKDNLWDKAWYDFSKPWCDLFLGGESVLERGNADKLRWRTISAGLLEAKGNSAFG